MKKWYTPGGQKYNGYVDMLAQPHLLIAGSTGSGKSVLINGLIHTALLQPPTTTQFILLDPKMVELDKFKKLPHCMGYADDLEGITWQLRVCVAMMQERYKTMKAKGLVQCDKPHIYIIIDEYADLVTKAQKVAIDCIIELSRLGRAANLHLILATQSPSRQVISAPIKANMTSRVALRCEEAIESRQIINQTGAELLPNYGYGIYRTPTYRDPVKLPIPMTDPAELAARVLWWTKQNKKWFWH